MTFKEAMENYRAGTASEEERQFVEQELEKSQLIAEYLDEQWDDKASVPVAPAEEMKQLRKTLRQRNILIVLTSLVLSAALLLGTVYIGIPAAEGLYWDPTAASYAAPYITDLELMLAAYTELFCPELNISNVTAAKRGFAAYDITVQYWDAYRGGESQFVHGSIEKGELGLPMGFLDMCAVNIFDRATYPFFPAREGHLEKIRAELAELPDYIRIVAAVSFPQDKNMEEVLAFQDSLIDGEVGWTAIRTGPLDEQILPLCGMNVFQWGSVRESVNGAYPCFDTKPVEKTPENLETHFKSLLRFSADQARNGTGIPEEYRMGQCYYTDALNYVEENGIYSYGCYVSGTVETFLALIDSGAVSQIRIEDIWISV